MSVDMFNELQDRITELEEENKVLLDCLNGSSKATYTAEMYDSQVERAEKAEARITELELQLKEAQDDNFLWVKIHEQIQRAEKAEAESKRLQDACYVWQTKVEQAEMEADNWRNQVECPSAYKLRNNQLMSMLEQVESALKEVKTEKKRLKEIINLMTEEVNDFVVNIKEQSSKALQGVRGK